MSQLHSFIQIRGAQANNLKNISLDLPKGRLIVFAGVSGSGKSSLVFDTIAVEAQRQLQEMFPPFIRSRMPHWEMPKAELIDGLTTAIVVDQRSFGGDHRSTVATMTDVAPMLRLLYSRCASPAIQPSQAYSYLDPAGMCPHCGGLGREICFDMEKMFDRTKSLNEGAILFPNHQPGSWQWQIFANSGRFDPDKPLRDYTQNEWEDFLYGEGGTVPMHNLTGKVWGEYALNYEGFMRRIERLYLKRELNMNNKTNRRIIEEFTTERVCPECGGTRLNAAARESRLLGFNIAELSAKEISDCIGVLERVKDPVGVPAAQKILRVLRAVEQIGLGYLSLDRTAPTLSGGESKRLKIVRQLGSSLVGLTYIFDEPTTGLHPKDVERLSRILLQLRERGNTVLVVEHHPDIIRIADRVVELGPAAGRLGGEVLFQGTVEQLRAADTPTGRMLRRKNAGLRTVREPRQWLSVRNASLHNLKNVDVDIPLHMLTAVTGLAGSGKSTLVCEVLVQQHPQVVHISQAPIGTNARSTPATYLGIMDEIRALLARENGVDAALFSYNAKGACPMCGGKGEIKTEMAFMDPVTRPCELCGGTRYNQESLQYRLNGKNILDILNLTVEEAQLFFHSPKILQKLDALSQVGMGYLTLGQQTSTLSGGECQRIKLASYLKTSSCVYVIDEPSSGLHMQDVQRLLSLFETMVERGNTVIVVEHDPDIILQADYVIDMGPEGGKNGGEILFTGTPRELLCCTRSATAEYLRRMLKNGDL